MARVFVIMGAEAQAVAVAWQVFEITHRAIDLGYTGLFLFLPGLLFLLPAGQVADRFDRRHVILACYSLQVLCTTALLVFAWRGITHVAPIFAVLFVIGAGRAFSGPASAALLPHLVPIEDFVNAVTWSATMFQIANFAGPAIGGLLYVVPLSRNLPGMSPHSFPGAAIVFLFAMASLAWFLVLVSMLHVRPGRMLQRHVSMDVILAGFRYVLQTKLLLGAITLDLFVVLLGGAVALMPIFASDILHTGPQGLGLLRAAPAVGALSISVWLSFRPLERRAGVKMLVAVAIFGSATALFGLSRNLLLSLGILALVGASDMISVVIRGAMLQLATPVEMRGRVSAVNSLFVTGSNELGEFESGLTAQWWGAVRAVVIGGIGALIVTGLWSLLFPDLRKADQLTPESLMSIGEAETHSRSKPMA